LKQIRIAETEKYRTCLSFSVAAGKSLLRGNKRIMIPSPKVATYDLQAADECIRSHRPLSFLKLKKLKLHLIV
jgi:bisphosphoglycerate-independent phosphoglycerate mutase (AlkP superfamily)